MKREAFLKRALRGLWKPVIMILAAMFFLAAVSNSHAAGTQRGREQLEQALRRAAVTCYACEGVYPPDTAWLEEHYGVQIDHERYAVFYEAFAENIMPEITVVVIQ